MHEPEPRFGCLGLNRATAGFVVGRALQLTFSDTDVCQLYASKARAQGYCNGGKLI